MPNGLISHVPSSVRRLLMSEAKQDDLYHASGYCILTNATVFTPFHDEGRFRMRNSQHSSIFVVLFSLDVPNFILSAVA